MTSSCSACQWFYSGGPTRPLSARAASDVGAQVQGRDGGSRRTPNSQLLLEPADQTGNRFFRTALRRLPLTCFSIGAAWVLGGGTEAPSARSDTTIKEK